MSEASENGGGKGPESQTGRLRIAVALVVFLAVGVFYLLDLGRSFGNSDEVIYAEFIRAMHQTGAYHELRYDGHVTLQRPPISVTLYALVSRVVEGEVGMRLLPSLLTILICVLAGVMVYGFEKRLDASVVATLVAAGCPSMYVYGRIVSNDPPFILASTVALWGTMAVQRNPRWLLWAFAAIGATFATKSFAGAIPAVALTPFLIVAVRRYWGDPGLRLLKSIAAFFIVALPYFLFSSLIYGERFIEEHFGFNLIQRARGEITGLGEGGPAFYLEHLFRVDGPITALLLFAALFAAGVFAVREKDHRLAVAVTYCVLVLVLFSVLRWRTGHYLLPFYPGAAVCAGVIVCKLVPRREGRSPIFRIIAPAIAATLMLYALANPKVEPSLRPSPTTMSIARVAREATTQGEKIYSFNWYSPALGYYADRSWGLLTTSERGAEIVHQSHIFKNAETVVLGPPWPSGRLVVAIKAEALSSARELRLGLGRPRILHRSGSVVLIEVDGAQR